MIFRKAKRRQYTKLPPFYTLQKIDILCSTYYNQLDFNRENTRGKKIP